MYGYNAQRCSRSMGRGERKKEGYLFSPPAFVNFLNIIYSIVFTILSFYNRIESVEDHSETFHFLKF